MRLLIQRVKRANVTVASDQVAEIGPGICAFVGVARDDSDQDCQRLARKLLNLRIFPRGSREFDRSVIETGGDILVVSQFTLCGDTSAGRRPSLAGAASPKTAARLYAMFVEEIQRAGVAVQTGRFQQRMEVALVNDGPVTFVVDST